MKDFKKSDLKNRMVVEYRNGDRRIVVDDRLIGISYTGYLSHYNENLTMNRKVFNCDGEEVSSRDFDIVRVYGKILSIDEMRRVNSYNKIWERQEVKEVTMAELEKMFGCKVKIVKEEEK